MKRIFRILKPWIKKVLIAQMQSNQSMIVNEILLKTKIPMSGEQAEFTINVLYDAVETIIAEQIDKI